MWVCLGGPFLKGRGNIMCSGTTTPRTELPSFITRRWLTDAGARCKDALKWFDCKFPNGGDLEDILAACSNRNWIYWLLYKSKP